MSIPVPPLIPTDAQFSDLQLNDKFSIPEVSISKAQRWKEPCNVATTAAGVLATSFAAGQTVDGAVLAVNDRLLIKDQAIGIENGLYVVTTGEPVRREDLQKGMDASGLAVFVTGGIANTGKGFTCSNPAGGGTVGTDALLFSSFTITSSGGALSLDSHLESTGPEPTSVVGTGGLAVVSLIANSTDTAGHITVTGTGLAGNTITVTYASPYDSSMQCIFISPRNAEASTGLTNGYFISSTTTQFVINFVGATGANPEFDYFIIDPVPP